MGLFQTQADTERVERSVTVINVLAKTETVGSRRPASHRLLTEKKKVGISSFLLFFQIAIM